MKVTISIPKREGFAGYWVLGKHFEAGTHEIDVEDAQLAELKADPIVSVMDGTAPKKAEDAPAAPKKGK